MKISILLPLKDCILERVETCINSILSQTYENFEVIVKYNGPYEEFIALAKRFDDDRLLFVASDDISIAQAANQAMAVSTGDIITLFAHDDTYCEGAFKTLIENIDESKWYFGNINYYVNSMGTSVAGWYVENPTIEGMRQKNLIPQPACFWKREVYEEVGKFDEIFKLCWDYDYWVRIMRKWKPKYIPFVFANYYLNTNSISLKYPERMEVEKTMVAQKHFTNE